MNARLCLFSYGGVLEATHDSILDEIAQGEADIAWRYDRVSGDALISRSRSVALSRFLDDGDDVCLMIDHDISWPAGDAAAICRKALEVDAAVAGLYAQRGIGSGFASRLTPKAATDARTRYLVGEDKLYEAECLAGGFLAIPRTVAQQMVNKLVGHADPGLRLTRCFRDPGPPPSYFWDFFRPIVVPSSLLPGEFEYSSEDWSVCHKIRASGSSTYIWSKPSLTHHGMYGYRLPDAHRPRPA